MAFNLCSSPSSLCNSLSSPSRESPKLRYLRVTTAVPLSRAPPSLQITHVSLSEPITQHQEHGTPQYPDAKKGSSSKSYIWVNPKNPRASQLKEKSYDARYASLVKIAESLNSCSPIQEDVYEILTGLGDKVLDQDAVVVINNMSNPETALLALRYFLEKFKLKKEVILYNVTIKVLRKCRAFVRAEKLFDEMLERGVQPDNATFSTIISCARLSNLPDKAVEWFEKMPSFGISPDDVTYSTMIDCYGRAGNVEMALNLYDRARTERWRIDAVTFSTLIKIYGMSGNFDGCLNVYEEMKALGAKPNLVTYNTLLDSMGRAKRPWQVKKIYKEMIDSGFKPSYVTYAALLRAYGRARYGEDALIVYREMKEKNLELNVILYNTILAMCADLGFVSEAIEIFEDIKSSGTNPDSWTFSSMITVYSCSGQVSEVENMMKEMLNAGFEPNIFVSTSLIQCYGKAQRTDDVVRTFNQLLESGVTPDERFCGCLLNVLTQIPKEELGKLANCIETANSKLGSVVKILIAEEVIEANFKQEASELFDSTGADVRKAYCNCLIDLCVNLNMLERACELLDLGLTLEIYKDIQSRSSTQWSLHLKSLSLGAALTALHVWINDLSKALESGDELPPLLGINTGHGKHKYSDKGLAGVFESHLKELNAPFHEDSDQVGWFLTTKVAAESWLESRKQTEAVAV
ncbi:pentatricopeptide repeat-containing protein At4g16390, chloroplastic [Mercurialis annua]|uniref:pentatricopeptide repeat-containing protein At4g16390, chloroplastic n=1 Tax=Mercurialis annua TaxID=3986 RepID=UPI00215F796A|nr:pentatricopeptide repeat-containing protein At4g16390, chloroplastic [Mercurialis annua]